MHRTLKLVLHWSGSALAIAGIAFVALRLREYGSEIDFARFSVLDWSAIFALVLIYGLSNLLLALAWWNLLRKFGNETLRIWAVKTYGVSQLAKYVPGNIFHLASRQSIGMVAGLPGWALAKSTIWELGLIAIAGAVFGLLATPLIVSSISMSSAVMIFMLTVTIAATLLGNYFGRSAVIAFVCYVIFLAVSAAIFTCLIKLVSSLSLLDALLWLALGGAYVLAWLAGFVTPGAPAGLGIRELVLLFLLNGLVGKADLLLAIVLSRAITVSGDCLFFVIAVLLSSKKNTYAE